MKEIRIEIPDDLASDANAAGLLAPEAIETLLRATLRDKAINGLNEFWSRLDDHELTPEMEAEIVEQVRKVRAERKAAA